MKTESILHLEWLPTKMYQSFRSLWSLMLKFYVVKEQKALAPRILKGHKYNISRTLTRGTLVDSSDTLDALISPLNIA